MNRKSAAAALAVAVVLLLAMASGCGTAEVTTTATADDADVVFDLYFGSGMRFDPAEMTVKVGQTVLLRVENTDTILHDWVIDAIAVADVTEVSADQHGPHTGHGAGHGHAHGADGGPDLHVAAGPGETATLSFTPLAAGSYRFYCAEPGHAAAGMVGTLTVQS